jgi:hypothetical protein
LALKGSIGGGCKGSERRYPARVAGVAPLWKRWSGGQRSTPRREEAVLEPPRNAHFTSSLVEPLAETLTLVGRPRLKMLNNIFDDERRGHVS